MTTATYPNNIPAPNARSASSRKQFKKSRNNKQAPDSDAMSSKQKLNTYTWSGRNHDGVITDGTIEAISPKVARLMLKQQGIRINNLKRLRQPRFGSSRIKREDVVTITRQLGTMLKSGIPIVQALDAVSHGSEKKSVRALLSRIRSEVETGEPLSTVLRRYPKQFDSLYIGLVSVGEESGTLDTMLVNIAAHLEKIESLKKKIRSAMTYPTVVLSVGIIIVVLLLVKIVPQFAQIFDSFNAELPWLTQKLLDISNSLREHFIFWALLVIGITFLVVVLYRNNRSFHYFLDRMALRIPVFGSLLKKGILARISRTISIMFRAGVPMVDTLGTISLAAGNDVYRRALEFTRSEVATGRALEPSMRETEKFPSLVLQMVRTGEATGEMDNMLDRAADFYDDEVDTAVATISSLVEPILIIGLGLIIGVVVVAMYLPIFKLASVF